MISVTHSHVKTNITLRPVAIPGDLTCLQQLTGLDVSCLIPFYESIHGSSFIQSMIAWDNDQPMLLVDICESLFDDLGASELVGPGDYTLRFQFATNTPIPILHQGLHSCIDHVFHDRKANRILVQIDKSNKVLLDWLNAANFTPITGLEQKSQYWVFILGK